MAKKISKIFYENKLNTALYNLHSEGRYRTFIEIERARGSFPSARWVAANDVEKSVTVWCGNDYLGMGQNSIVICLLYTSPSPRDRTRSRMPSSA